MTDSIPPEKRRCTGCGEEFPPTLEHFYRQRGGRFGINSKCKKCSDKRHKDYVTKNQEKVSERERGWRNGIKVGNKRVFPDGDPTSREYRQAVQKQWDEKNPEKVKKKIQDYAERQKQKTREKREQSEEYIMSQQGKKRCSACHEWFPADKDHFYGETRAKTGRMSQCISCWNKREISREKQGAYNKKWRDRNPEKVRAIRKRKYLKDYDKILAYNRLRKARELNAPGELTEEDVQKQYQRQKGKCYYCGKKLGKRRRDYHADHIVPLTREGSTNHPDNIVIACPHCNDSKCNRLPHEWPQGGRLL